MVLGQIYVPCLRLKLAALAPGNRRVSKIAILEPSNIRFSNFRRMGKVFLAAPDQQKVVPE
jgi:hypothetical protein